MRRRPLLAVCVCDAFALLRRCTAENTMARLALPNQSSHAYPLSIDLFHMHQNTPQLYCVKIQSNNHTASINLSASFHSTACGFRLLLPPRSQMVLSYLLLQLLLGIGFLLSRALPAGICGCGLRNVGFLRGGLFLRGLMLSFV